MNATASAEIMSPPQNHDAACGDEVAEASGARPRAGTR
jgi:hypothetical protein